MQFEWDERKAELNLPWIIHDICNKLTLCINSKQIMTIRWIEQDFLKKVDPSTS